MRFYLLTRVETNVTKPFRRNDCSLVERIADRVLIGSERVYRENSRQFFGSIHDWWTQRDWSEVLG